MPEMLKARVISSHEMIEFQDVEPLESAILFKNVSDAIWAQKPENMKLARHRVASGLNALEVRDSLNEIVGDVDQNLVISGIGKALDLGAIDSTMKPVIIDAEIIDNPVSAVVETFNWDNFNTLRYVELDGKSKAVKFMDGHKDYSRELSIKLNLGKSAVANYVMQRVQADQDSPTSINLSVWHSAFAISGYEGQHITSSVLSEHHEIQALNLIQRMVGSLV